MDPHLFDLLWETYREVGATEPIQVICGYRSPGTNAMLRARSSGVAQFSQHINGNAIDFYIPGVPLAKVRAEGLRLQRGGVGFYPTSGSPFVHMDTGTIRHWPRIPREELVKIFPDGRTVHIPADGQPLPGYALALADVERHGAVPSGTSLEAAREAGVITASQEADRRAAPSSAACSPACSAAARTRMSRASSRRPNGWLAAARAHGRRQPEPAPSRSRSSTSCRCRRRGRSRSMSRIALPRPRPAEQPIVTASARQDIRQPRLLARRGRGRRRRCRRRSRPARRMRRPRADPATTGSAATIRSPMPPASQYPARRARAPDGLAPAPHAGGSARDPGLVQHHCGGKAAARWPWPWAAASGPTARGCAPPC